MRKTTYLARHDKTLFATIVIAIVGFMCFQSQPSFGEPPPVLTADAVEATLSDDWSGATLDVITDRPPKASSSKMSLSVSDEAGASLNRLAPKMGDIIEYQLASPGTKAQVKSVASVSRPIPNSARLVALLASGAFLLMVASIFTWWKPSSLLIGVDNRYSNSQTQIVLWFAALITVYIATLALRVLYLGWDYFGNVRITANLLALSGLSAFTFGTARVITTTKTQSAAAQILAGANVPQKTDGGQAKLSDLLKTDNGTTDVGDFQMIFIAVVAVVIFTLSAYHFLETLELAREVTLPDVDTTLLSLFGVGQGAYLVKKAGSAPGEG